MNSVRFTHLTFSPALPDNLTPITDLCFRSHVPSAKPAEPFMDIKSARASWTSTLLQEKLVGLSASSPSSSTEYCSGLRSMFSSARNSLAWASHPIFHSP